MTSVTSGAPAQVITQKSERGSGCTSTGNASRLGSVASEPSEAKPRLSGVARSCTFMRECGASVGKGISHFYEAMHPVKGLKESVEGWRSMGRHIKFAVKNRKLPQRSSADPFFNATKSLNVLKGAPQAKEPTDYRIQDILAKTKGIIFGEGVKKAKREYAVKSPLFMAVEDVHGKDCIDIKKGTTRKILKALMNQTFGAYRADSSESNRTNLAMVAMELSDFNDRYPAYEIELPAGVTVTKAFNKEGKRDHQNDAITGVGESRLLRTDVKALIEADLGITADLGNSEATEGAGSVPDSSKEPTVTPADTGLATIFLKKKKIQMLPLLLMAAKRIRLENWWAFRNKLRNKLRNKRVYVISWLRLAHRY